MQDNNEHSIKKKKSFLEKLKDTMYEMMAEETERNINEPHTIAYNNIVEKTSSFFKDELKVDDPVTASIIFEYLLWNGYYSKDNSFKFSTRKTISDFGCFGADIMRGYGQCLNIAHMLSDVLNKSGYRSYPTICYCNVPKIIGKKRKECPPIEQHLVEENENVNEELEKKYEKILKALEHISKRTGNHVIVSTEYEDIFFGSDPTNLCFVTYKSKRFTKAVNSNIKYKLKPLVTRIINTDRDNETRIIFENRKRSHKGYPNFLDKDQIKQKYNEEVNFCDSKKGLLDEFHKDCLKDIDIVCNTLTFEKTFSPEEIEMLNRSYEMRQKEIENNSKRLTKKIR